MSTLNAVTVDAVNLPEGILLCGPMIVGTKIYAFASATNSDTFRDVGTPIAYESLDGGNTFNSVGNSAFSRPTYTSHLIYYQPSSTKLTFLYEGTNAKALEDFDCVTRTWSGLYGVTTGFSATSRNVMLTRADTTNRVIVCYNHFGGSGDQNILCDDYDIGGGTWSANHLQVNSSTPNNSAAILKSYVDVSTGRTHLAYQIPASPPPGTYGANYTKIGYNYIDPTNPLTVGAETVLPILPQANNSDNYVFQNVFADATNLYLLFLFRDVVTRQVTIQSYKGTPINAPVWSIDSTIATNSTIQNADGVWPWGWTFGTTTTIIIETNGDFFGTPPTLVPAKLWSISKTSGAWQAPAQLWDSTTNLPADWDVNFTFNEDPFITFFQCPSIGIILVGAMAGENNAFGDTVMFWGTGTFGDCFAPPTPPTIACPINNTDTIGVPYVGTIVASGGTPPYTFAIISGALPPGLSLNPATGVISGTPTLSGTYSYTVKVTDAHGLTAQITCSLMISPARNPGSITNYPMPCP